MLLLLLLLSLLLLLLLLEGNFLRDVVASVVANERNKSSQKSFSKTCMIGYVARDIFGRSYAVFFVRDVRVCFGVSISLRESKVDEINLCELRVYAHEEIFRLDVAVEKIFRMNVF